MTLQALIRSEPGEITTLYKNVLDGGFNKNYQLNIVWVESYPANRARGAAYTPCPPIQKIKKPLTRLKII
jgi:hypothetical protein